MKRIQLDNLVITDNGKPKVIWGRKVVHPKFLGTADYRNINGIVSQVNLPGIFFKISESARHQTKNLNRVPGIPYKKINNKEKKDA